MNWLRILLWKMGWIELVILRDFDGEESLRMERSGKLRKFWQKPALHHNTPRAVRVFGTRVVALFADGSVVDAKNGSPCYVESWRYLERETATEPRQNRGEIKAFK